METLTWMPDGSYSSKLASGCRTSSPRVWCEYQLTSLTVLVSLSPSKGAAMSFEWVRYSRKRTQSKGTASAAGEVPGAVDGSAASALGGSLALPSCLVASSVVPPSLVSPLLSAVSSPVALE